MAKGSCLCGTVRFEIDNTGVLASVACLCGNCRKVSGSQYAVYLQVKPAGFRWLGGEDAVAEFESSPGNMRGFCSRCGCPAPVRTGYGAVRVPAGALDEDPQTAPGVILYEGDGKSWCSLDQAVTRFSDTGPPDYWRKLVMRLHGLL